MKVLLEEVPLDNYKESGKYKIKGKKFHFSKETKEVNLAFDAGTNSPTFTSNGDNIEAVDFEFVYPLEPQALSDIGLKAIAAGAPAAGAAILAVFDTLLSAVG